MGFRETSGGKVELALSLDQLKRIYVALFAHLRQAPLDDLDEDDLLLRIQTYLQRKAREAGVDATDHAQWDAFVGNNGRSCARRAP
ncbi:MAG: hypothetical protein HZB38_03550 [Planctomycetes bacterium]|nr:hypothetical protein [Planctomycetota bacterium]